MSEKRFTMKYSYEDEEYVIYDDGNPLTPSRVVKKLNEQQATISQLKEENEQLRQQQQRLYNYFRDYLEDEMSAENFGEMWDTVKVDERWNR